ncbi:MULTISPECIES: cysteine desulfurase family protein [unclassified Sphingomonas]|uniref:cysteine desulfurase family protein n=1 Tax=unclassified Sphingomonas TaxID=196159 RepID=UPI00285F2C25|nr:MULTISPECIES: cysteine desulfurase family protein [unclassified Sphingomonas]MDR6115077.1 cysteine desulfurase [Sphingomonas sp. SORGH_AS_0789]MDR6151249.1 cysteine desulfurase [Sphingomonas sp. SORGH_AS_0742]
MATLAETSCSPVSFAPGGDHTVVNLDANANAAPTAAVLSAVVEAMTNGAGNPSSGHLAGDLARGIVERTRDSVVALLEGAFEDGVVFTSGCTEANNTVLRGMVGHTAQTLFVSTVEHASVLKVALRLAVEFTEVRFVRVDADGVIDLGELEVGLQGSPDRSLISIQTANSETGVIQPVAAIADLARRYGAIYHADAAQSFGKIRTVLGRGHGPDVITLSGHKLHAPAGTGAIVSADAEIEYAPLIVGGDQEHGRRAGTQSVPLLAGLAAACEQRGSTLDEDVAMMSMLRDRLESGIRTLLPWTVVNGVASPRLPNASNIRFVGVDGMALVANLDAEGILASQGSACSSRRPEPSHVLTAMGLSEADAFSSVRFSVSPLNTLEEIDHAVQIIVAAATRLRGGL